MVEEVDMSDHLLERFREEKIEALISIVGGRGLSIMYKLHRKGLNTVCIPVSIENDIASTMISFGFNSALSFTIEMLDRMKQAARSVRKIAVVEVGGKESGWLALQAGIATGADAILIPEIPCDLDLVAEQLKERMSLSGPYALVVVAEGARLVGQSQAREEKEDRGSLRDSLAPLAHGESGKHVIQRSGLAAETVAKRLQLMLAEESYPAVIGPWVRGGAPTAIDRQLGIAYGAGAVEALNADRSGVMVSFMPPDIDFVPLTDAINKVRTVHTDSEFMQIADLLGISLGGAQ